MVHLRCRIEQAAAAPLSAMAAASKQLAVARTVSEIVEAANEHLLAAAVESEELGAASSSRRLKLDLGKIARVRQLGKAWHKATARSSGGSTARSTGGTGSTGRVERGSDAAASYQPGGKNKNSRSSNGGDSSSTRAMLLPPKPVASGSTSAPVLPVPSVLQGSEPTAARAGSAEAPTRTSTAASLQPQPQQQQQDGRLSSASKSAEALTAAAAAAATSRGSGEYALPGMRLTAPRLQVPTEVAAAVPLPSLPELLDLSHEPAKVLQARLQRVWNVLDTPPEQQMGMVLRWVGVVLTMRQAGGSCGMI